MHFYFLCLVFFSSILNAADIQKEYWDKCVQDIGNRLLDLPKRSLKEIRDLAIEMKKLDEKEKTKGYVIPHAYSRDMFAREKGVVGEILYLGNLPYSKAMLPSAKRPKGRFLFKGGFDWQYVNVFAIGNDNDNDNDDDDNDNVLFLCILPDGRLSPVYNWYLSLTQGMYPLDSSDVTDLSEDDINLSFITTSCILRLSPAEELP